MEPTVPIRKRMKRHEIPGGVRYITFSCEKRLPLLGSAPARDIFSRSLGEAKQRFGFELFAWVAMPEHVHLLVRPPPGIPLDRVLLSIKLSATQRLLARMRQTSDPVLPEIMLRDGAPRVWQKGGGFDRNVRNAVELEKEIRYIHRNPVKRGLVASPGDWSWSSARWWMGQRERELPCEPPPDDPRAFEYWQRFM